MAPEPDWDAVRAECEEEAWEIIHEHEDYAHIIERDVIYDTYRLRDAVARQLFGLKRLEYEKERYGREPMLIELIQSPAAVTKARQLLNRLAKDQSNQLPQCGQRTRSD